MLSTWSPLGPQNLLSRWHLYFPVQGLDAPGGVLTLHGASISRTSPGSLAFLPRWPPCHGCRISYKVAERFKTC